jgi:hypothetical protein
MKKPQNTQQWTYTVRITARNFFREAAFDSFEKRLKYIMDALNQEAFAIPADVTVSLGVYDTNPPSNTTKIRLS